MQCKVFIGRWDEAMNAFNKWAKGKALTKEVIIHTTMQIYRSDVDTNYYMVIAVYHPETAPWQEVVS